MGLPRILRSGDIVPDATLTASATDTGYPAANITDWKDYTLWQASGNNVYTMLVDVGAGTWHDDFDDLTAWTETDAFNTLSIAANKLNHNSAAQANDNPDIDLDGTLTVGSAFAMELLFDVTSFATADTSEAYFLIEFTANYFIRLKIDSNGGTPRVTFQRDADAGSWTDVGNYTLSGGTSGRAKFIRETDGDVVASVYDDNDSAYHALGTYAGGSSYQVTTLNSLVIEFSVVARTAGAQVIDCNTLYHCNAQSIDSMVIAGHNLNTVGVTTIYLGTSVGGVGYATDISSFSPPNGDDAIAKFFTPSQPARYYQLVFHNGGGANFIPQIGIFGLTAYIELPRVPRTPHDPDHMVDHSNIVTGGQGHRLGVTNDYTHRMFTYSSNLITQTFITNTWIPFLESYRHSNFVWVWDYENKPNEAYLMGFTRPDHTMPYSGKWRQLNFELSGRYIE